MVPVVVEQMPIINYNYYYKENDSNSLAVPNQY